MTLRMIQLGFLPLRAQAVRRYILHRAASFMLEEVVARIPTGREYLAYKKSLELVQFGTSNPVFSVAAVMEQESQADAQRDLIYFKATDPKRQTPLVRVLVQFGPWTADTVPVIPPTKDAKRYSRRVSAAEVESVRRQLGARKSQWMAALQKVGVRPTTTGAFQTAIPDMAYAALRLEYGLGGSRAVAHWRPALRATTLRVSALFEDTDDIARAMLDWRFDGWRRWRGLSASPIPATTLESFAAFEDKIR